ncbi:MAG TPA: molybdopterin-dependent oxidoreductase [Burkholderiaceae bacterium]|nr:molybdopterin-dependent oxidoreductase [Burkholderiaceae bacterium]
MRETKSTCPYCGVGCGVIIESDGEQIIGVRGDPAHPANFGRLCSKGSTLHLTATQAVTLHTRLLQPMRRHARGELPQAIAWDAALDLAAERIARTVQTHGPDAVGLYLSGQLLTEDYYVFNKLARALIGTNNVDTNSRLCMSSAVAGYKLTLGADAPPACYEDLDHARSVFISGSNLAWAHPILMRRLEDARRAQPEQKWIVIDPRRTETAALADLHLQIQPGTDITLAHGIAHLMLWENLADTAYVAAHTHGFEAYRDLVREYTPREVATACGIREADLVQAARWFAGVDPRAPRGRWPTLSLYCQGLNQSVNGTHNNAAWINLHLLSGQIGRPGAGPFSLTGQPNAMGGREVGALANQLAAHRDLGKAEHRAEMAALWGVREVPSAPGRSAVELFEAAADGQIKLLWIACTNPAQSMPDQAMVRRALERCDFVIVQEAFRTTATGAYADLLLPASTWGEKEGSVTNSERRISRVRAAVTAPGAARADWRIAADVARRLEPLLQRARTDGRASGFEFADAAQVWCEHRASTRGRDLDITGLSYPMLDERGPQQWPLPSGATAGRSRLYEGGGFQFDDGRARFAAVKPLPLAEARNVRHPYSLTTGRLRDQWHGMSRTGTLGRLFGHASEPVIELHPRDLDRLNARPGDLLQVTSRRGSIVLPAQASDAMAPMQAHIAMHWGAEALGGASANGRALAGVNTLTTGAFCPTSKQPELKHCAVKLLKAELPWKLLAMAWLPQADAHTAREALRALMPLFAYAACVPFGREPDARGRLGLMFRAAAHERPTDEVLARIERLLGVDGAQALRYVDARRGLRRTITLAGQGDAMRVQAFVLAGSTDAEPWLRALLVDEEPAQAYGRSLLRADSAPPGTQPPRSPQVCTCHDVSEARIREVLASAVGAPAERLTALQRRLRCGTECGSCLPTLKRLVATA